MEFHLLSSINGRETASDSCMRFPQYSWISCAVSWKIIIICLCVCMYVCMWECDVKWFMITMRLETVVLAHWFKLNIRTDENGAMCITQCGYLCYMCFSNICYIHVGLVFNVFFRGVFWQACFFSLNRTTFFVHVCIFQSMINDSIALRVVNHLTIPGPDRNWRDCAGEGVRR